MDISLPQDTILIIVIVVIIAIVYVISRICKCYYLS